MNSSNSPIEILSTVLNGRQQKHIAERAGVSQQTVNRWFNAQNDPKVVNFFAFIEAAGYRLTLQRKLNDRTATTAPSQTDDDESTHRAA